MRQTLSLLTAACILALSQPAFASVFDHESQQRARTMVMQLSRKVRVHTARTLSFWQSQTVSAPRRLLPLNRILRATQLWLQQEGHTLVLRLHAMPLLRSVWPRTAAESADQFSPSLEASMVERWLQSWQQRYLMAQP